MGTTEKFHYRTLEELKGRLLELGIDLPFAEDTYILRTPLTVDDVIFPNRLGIAPMEGADSLPDGSPSDMTLRRYVRDAEGGSAIIWFEAISIVEEGRSSKTQLLLTKKKLYIFHYSAVILLRRAYPLLLSDDMLSDYQPT